MRWRESGSERRRDAYFREEGLSRGIVVSAISLWETDVEDDSCASWRRVGDARAAGRESLV